MATDPVQAETSNVLEAVPVRKLVGHSNRIMALCNRDNRIGL